jgi:hypothetical protein
MKRFNVKGEFVPFFRRQDFVENVGKSARDASDTIAVELEAMFSNQLKVVPVYLRGLRE